MSFFSMHLTFKNVKSLGNINSNNSFFFLWVSQRFHFPVLITPPSLTFALRMPPTDVFQGRMQTRFYALLEKFTVDRLHWNKPPFELVLLYCLVDEKLRSGNSILRLNLSFYWPNKTTGITVFGHSSARLIYVYVSVWHLRHCWTAVVCTLHDLIASDRHPFFGTVCVVIWGALDV